MFGGTFAWFVKTLNDITITGQMGKVDIELTDNDGEVIITNNSDIPILLRVRVIVEPDDPSSGVPEGYNGIPGILKSGDGWVEIILSDGIFFVYGDNTKTGYDLYTPVDVEEAPQFVYKAPEGYNTTLIAEALQATEKAYKYTTDTDTSWEVN